MIGLASAGGTLVLAAGAGRISDSVIRLPNPNARWRMTRRVKYGQHRGTLYFGRGGYGCLGGTMIRGTDLARVGSSSLEGSGNLFSLRSQAAR